MPEYTFTLGDVNHTPGLYLSWIVEAGSEEEAVTLSREFFGADDPAEVGHHEDTDNFYGIILRADPDEIGPENIIDVFERPDASPDSRLQGR